MQQTISLVSESESVPDVVDYFATLAWSVICEPGDAFAGQLISTFGPARALELEIRRTSPHGYLDLFNEVGTDPLEVQKFGKFEKTILDARERWLPRMNLKSVFVACERLAGLGGWFVIEGMQGWPLAFADLEDHSPRGLWGIGDKESLANLGRSVAFVASRMATPYGESACQELIQPLAERGYSIVSGGAYGIDAAAHRAAISAAGKTFALMAGGVDRLYPSGNRELFKTIASHGALLSEMPPGAEPTKWRFLQRNRLIATLGQATVVVEANPRSGAVSTANRARELGRPIAAVPGPINTPGSDGCHQLIRNGEAELVTCAEDILELIVGGSTLTIDAGSGLGALETRVLDAIGFSGATLGSIQTLAGLTSSEAQIGLASLSLMGVVEQDSVGWRRKS
jgi:DNA processing protein